MFFTSAEALLTSRDDRAPITDTIARNSAVILHTDPRERLRTADLIRKLYNRRSDVVHRGGRDVSKSDADNIQLIVEALYAAVIERVDLLRPHKDFAAELGQASYGLPWPDEP
jgi:hypothetical protein